MADTLEFQNLKHIKSGLGLTPVSIVDKCLGCLLYSRVHGGAMPTGRCGMRLSVGFLQATANVLSEKFRVCFQCSSCLTFLRLNSVRVFSLANGQNKVEMYL